MRRLLYAGNTWRRENGFSTSFPPPACPSPSPPLQHLSTSVARTKPTQPTGVPYAFRCARENADGEVGPWSADLRCVVPCLPRKCGGRSGAGSGNNISNGSVAADPHRFPPPPEATLRTSQPRQHQHRFELLVPALVEAFAELVDAGDSRITRSTPVNTRLAQPPPSSLPPAPHPTATKNSDSAAKAVAVKTSDAEGRAHHNQQRISLEGKGENKEMVWEEHWDTQRRAPFFRLRGQNLSVWQIPAL